jgi:hypothetical protein
MARHAKQIAFEFRTWGGERAGAGRPQVNRRRSEPHRRREELAPTSPVHVTLRLVDELAGLRCAGAYHAIRAALHATGDRPEFGIVHTSIQRTHLHLVAEAEHERALAAGLHAFQISAAQRLKSHVLATSGRAHAGPVFIDRYHPEILDSPTQTRHALGYVLLNWRRHGEDADGLAATWLLDPYSTALSFTGWSEQPAGWTIPDAYLPFPAATPRTWLLREGWKRVGPISMFSRPGAK